MILSSEYTVAFTGAGISTASGLPDYRGSDGLLTRKAKGLPPKKSEKPWYQHDPNAGHLALVEMIKGNQLNHIISQNVDGLHLKSGIPSSKISELHGNSSLMRCTYCANIYHIDTIGWNRQIHGRGRLDEPVVTSQPVCLNCSGRLISTIVDFGDPLPEQVIDQARAVSIQADLFIVMGSSLKVNPAASLPKLAKRNGAQLVIINKGSTHQDQIADLRIEDDLSVLLPKIVEML